MGFLHEARVFFIGEKPATALERKLLFKLDSFILSFICLAQFVNYLDRMNFVNAYVSGMKEDLNFQGNDYNISQTIFQIGYIIGGVPQSFIVASRKIPLSFWFPFCVLGWGSLNLGIAFCNHVWQAQILRFMMGLFESVSFAGAHYVVGSWYKPEEMAKRACLVTASINMGGLFSGWLIIINFLITAVVWIWGFLFFPGAPDGKKRWYFTAEEWALAIDRIPERKHTPLNLGVFKKVLTDWRFWAFVMLFSWNTHMEFSGLYAPMSLWMKWTGNYTIPQINYHPLGVTAVAVGSTCLFALWSDYSGSRWWVNPVMAFAAGTSCIMLLVPSLPVAGKYFAWYLAGMGYIGQAVNFSWANEMCREDDQLRSLTLYAMVYGSNVSIAWFNIAFFPVTDLPNFTKGYSAALAICVLSGPAAWFLHRACQKRNRRIAEEMEEAVVQGRKMSVDGGEEKGITQGGKTKANAMPIGEVGA